MLDTRIGELGESADIELNLAQGSSVTTKWHSGIVLWNRSAIRLILILAIASVADAFMPNGVAGAGIVSVTTTTAGPNGIYTQLVNLTLSGVGTVSPGAGLGGVNVFGYAPTNGTTMSSVTAFSPDPTTSDFSGTNMPGLLTDSYLNTGLANPGGTTSGLSSGFQPIEGFVGPPVIKGTNGLGINFNTPLANVPGAGFVVFDFAQSSLAPDSFVVNALSGGEGFSSHEVGAKVTISNANYQVSGTVQSTQTYTELNPVGSLSVAEGPLTPGVAYATPLYHAIEIPLSSFNLNPGVTQITGLWFESVNFDPVFIAGIAIPEPSAGSLLAFGSIGLWLLNRCRNNRSSVRTSSRHG